jgi:signal transduction histidine kinase
MDLPGLGESGKTLGRGEGHADLSVSRISITVRRSALAGLAISALVAGVVATSAALQGVAHPGVVSEDVGGQVLAVSPIGFAWAQGIRPGQRVVAVVPADEPGGWQFETTDGRNAFVARAAFVEQGLRDSLPIGVAAVVLGAFAVLFLRARRAWTLPATSVALLASSAPLAIQGDPTASTLALAAAVLPPVPWLVGRVRVGWVQGAVLGFVVGLLVVWVSARLGGWEAYQPLEDLRSAVAIWGAVGLLADRAVLPVFTADPFRMTRPKLFDVAYVAVVIAVALVLANAFGVPSPIVVAAVVLALVALPTARRRFAPIENAVLADIRAQAAAEGAEAERGRLARELHDAPLQELIGVIRRLELKPGTEAEYDDLRALAGHLRSVAIELRPPVLDDFGLPAALDYLAEQMSSPKLPVRTRLEDGTTFDQSGRPPTDVELAVFRIASEAVTNARRHAAAAEIWIDGRIRPDVVDVMVRDDGKGFPEARLTLPLPWRRRQLGLSSMRWRAQAIDAELDIDSTNDGTRVRVTWQR